MNSKELVSSLKDKIKDKTKELQNSRVKKSTETTQEIDLWKTVLTALNNQQSEINFLNQKVNNFNKNSQQNLDPYLSTTDFFDSSLAKDLYNFNGNSLQVNSYLAMRQLLGIANGANGDGGTSKQTISGVNIENGVQTNSSTNNPNGTGVGLTKAKGVQGWWLWIFILNRIDYFSQLVTWKSEDKALLKVMDNYMFNVICAGYGLIKRTKKDDGKYKYHALACATTKRNKDGEIVLCEAYDTHIIMNYGYSKERKDDLQNVKVDEDVVVGQWKTNGYNIWFYVLSYLIQGTDFIYIFWNKLRMTKTFVLQKKGNDAYASDELKAIINPYQLVVTVNSAGYSDSESAQAVLENRYETVELGDPEVNDGMLKNFFSWMSYWDGVIGIRTIGEKVWDVRSVSDEIKPFNLKTDKVHQTFIKCLDNLKEEIKEKWNVTIDYEYGDEQDTQADPEFKKEGGNQTEQTLKNGDENA